jgi:WD40 repeat protein
MEGHEDRITDVGFAPTGQYLASSSLDNTLRLWDVESGEQFRFQRSRNRPQMSLDVNQYGSSVASGTTGGTARLLNVAITTEGQYRLQPRADVVDVEYTPDGLLLALAGGNSLFLWTMDTREPPVVYNLSASPSCISFNADGSELLVGAADGLHIFAVAG